MLTTSLVSVSSATAVFFSSALLSSVLAAALSDAGHACSSSVNHNVDHATILLSRSIAMHLFRAILYQPHYVLLGNASIQASRSILRFRLLNGTQIVSTPLYFVSNIMRSCYQANMLFG